ncbi:MAG: hypothetical protein OXH39_04160 [Candidatus Poribacteria bacterium]|nr:hypothetical protein [Candidatus Poribacteria bacterium]
MLTLSKNLTFSLTFLVVLLAFGLAFYVPSAMADHGSFDVTISADVDMEDVSSDGGGIQIASGRNREAARALTEGTIIRLSIKTAQIVNLSDPDVTNVDVEDRGDANALDVTDLVVDAYDAEGRSLGILKNTAETATTIQLSHRDPTNPGKEFLVTIDAGELTDAYTAQRGGGQQLEIHTLLFSIPKDRMERADEAFITLVRNDGHAVSKNNRAAVYKVQLVDDDEGNPQYNMGVSGTAVGDTGVPGVVGVDRLDERRASGFIETGDFTVRVILTEEPNGIADIMKDATKLIDVQNGKATAITKGTTLKGAHVVATSGSRSAQTSELTRDITNYTDMAGTNTAALPDATGRDNMYHTYFVTISPNDGHNGYVTVSIKSFDDKVLPVPNTYTPLTAVQRVSRVLTDAQTTVRNARLANETLMVRVNKAAAAKTDVVVAYEARQKVLDGVTNDTTLGAKLVVPAGGYLVIHGADIGDTGIVDPGNKVNTKKLDPAKALYNITKLSLTFPADDLDNFFRNGGTLNLGYADITEATGSGHGDAKSPQADKAHADYTGYDGASTNAYAAGALIINEIMWGLDGNDKTSQYIELHNPGTAAIGIDSKEWVISVGSLPAGYTLIDSAGNNPASGFWQVPGMGGVTSTSADHPVVSDLVSMSRVADAVDGTAAASWAMSMRPSSNLSGRRVGTPGAANSYVMPPPAPVTPPAPPPPASTPTPGATAADITITEIMADSGNGRFPQWIELTNQAAEEVSLDGWMLNISNDPADTDVVGSSLVIDLSGNTLGVSANAGNMGKGQSLLIIAYSGRGSGNLSNVAIIDASSADQLDQTGRYMLLSETAFKLVLMPPQDTGVTQYGDMAGNLENGAAAWALPMAEGMRSSLIRREMDAMNMATMGTAANGWRQASMTDLASGQITWYGSDEDAGTPGYDAGGPLPVELSMFYPKRDQLTGQVVIKWETQSELNNAGFFIKRSEAEDGEFKVINQTMIAGAGTTSEKQSYTYTDTSAKPNVVYYYQIEDVSLDGQRQLLTIGTRLRGHVGAAGKLTATWGELKKVQE